jgi:CRISPR-associated endonuclease Cas2
MGNNIKISRNEKPAFIEVAKVVLKYALLGAAVGIFLASPTGLSKIIPELNRLRKKHGDKIVDKSLNKIVKDRFVKIVEKNGETTLRITEKGKVRLINFDIDTIKIQLGRWDGKWRFVIFDIPEKKRIARDVLRQKLKEIGFVQIQKSVWACPYECEEEIAFISSVYEVERYVNYIIAAKIDHEEYLKSKFDLK